jgi:hypothetical protein
MRAAVAPRSAPGQDGLLDHEADGLVRDTGFAPFLTQRAGELLS